MQLLTLPPVDPWRAEIVVVREGSHSDGERSALRRDEARGLLRRLGRGSYVERAAFDAMEPEDRHVVRMRALQAARTDPITFSHWSAAVLHGLPVLRRRLAVLHVTVATAGARSGDGVTGHVFALDDGEVVGFGGLRATGVGRTVVDLAGAAPFEEGVMAADGALLAGVPPQVLAAALDAAGPRRAARRMRDVVAFAHPGAESAAESRFRVSAMRLGIEVPRLQHRIVLEDGAHAYLDALLRDARVGVETDGDRKYLDPVMAPEGAGRAVIREKRREDEVRTHLAGLVRIGWVQAGSAAALGGVLGRVGVRPVHPRPTLSDYAAEAALARPRFLATHPRWRA